MTMSDCTPTFRCLQAGRKIILRLEDHVFERMTQVASTASRSTRIEPRSGKRKPVWTASGQKTGPRLFCKGLVDLSTLSNGSTQSEHKAIIQVRRKHW